MFSATSNAPQQPNSKRELCVLVNTETKGWPDPDSAVCALSRQLPSHTLQRGSKEHGRWSVASWSWQWHIIMPH